MFNYYFIIKPCNYARGKDIHIVSFDLDFTSYVQYLHIQKHLYRMKVSIQQTLTPLNSVLSMVCTVSKQNEGQHSRLSPPPPLLPPLNGDFSSISPPGASQSESGGGGRGGRGGGEGRGGRGGGGGKDLDIYIYRAGEVPAAQIYHPWRPEGNVVGQSRTMVAKYYQELHGQTSFGGFRCI